MNTAFQLDLDQWLEEGKRFQQKLESGLRTLQEVDDIDYGATSREVVWRDGKVALYRFVGKNKPATNTPLLICYALVNRPYMVDLQADRSIVQGLLARGEDVYILDWGYPDRSGRFLTLEDYIERFIGGAVEYLRGRFELDAINLLGICQGGALSLCYSALYPQYIKNLITMVTPVDFHTPDNMLSNWVRQLDVDLFVDTLGNVPADMMNLCYLTLKPWRLFVHKYVAMVDILDDRKAMEDFLRMEKWIFDSPDQAGEAFREFVKQFYQDNGFINGNIDIGGKIVDLRRITMPVFNLYAEQDHLVPPDASRALKALTGSDDYSELSFRGGHIGIYVSSRAQREIPAAICDWLQTR